MGDDGWDEPAEDMIIQDGDGDLAIAPTAELPEIKLFGRWSCDDVQVSDMSLQVCLFEDYILQCLIIHQYL